MSAVELHLCCRVRAVAPDNKSLTVPPLGDPTAPRGVPQVQVSFGHRCQRLAAGLGTDRTTGRSAERLRFQGRLQPQ